MVHLTKIIQKSSADINCFIVFLNPKEPSTDNLLFPLTLSEGTSIRKSSSSKIPTEKSQKQALEHVQDNSSSAGKNVPVAPTQDASESMPSSPVWDRDRFKGTPKIERPASKLQEYQFGSKFTNNKDLISCTDKDIIFKKDGNYSFVMYVIRR